MTAVLVCWVLFPIALVAVSLGCGLLLEQTARTTLPGALLPAAGFAVVLVAAHMATALDTTAELALPLVLALAVAGYALAWPVGRGRIDRCALVAAGITYAVFAAPILLSGAATFAGYIKLDDTATWLAMTDRLMEHGRNLDGLPPSSYEATLALNLTSGYPVGAFPPLGIGSKLVGQDPAWTFQPYMALLAALMASALYVLAMRVIDSPRQRAFAAIVASQSALLFGYSLWGGVKELAAAWAIALLAALIPPLVRARPTALSVLPLAAGSAALLAVLSFGGIVWLAPILLPAAVMVFRSRGTTALVASGVGFVGLAVLLSLPSLLQAEVFLRPAEGALTSDTELGNLVEPLSRLQLAGIWPVGDFRLEPEDPAPAYVLIAVVVGAAVLGFTWAWKRQAWELILYVVAAVGGAVAISIFASPWVEAKALATGSPAVVLLGLVGAAAIARRGRRVEAAVLGLAITGGVVWSNMLAYNEVMLAPRERLVELEQIGDSIAGEGPTLMTDYEPYGVRHFLRDGEPEGASELRRRVVPLRNGRALDKLETADIDEFDTQAVLVYRTLVLRRSPVGSRPPSIYGRVRRGRFYDVWQRPAGEPPLSEHLSLGGNARPTAPAPCGAVRRLAEVAPRDGGRLAITRGPAAVSVPLLPAPGSDWTVDPGTRGAIVPRGDGAYRTNVNVPRSGPYTAYVGGAFHSRLTLLVDGRVVSDERDELSHTGQYTPLGNLHLRAGRHEVELRYDEDDVRPGSGAPEIAMGPLFFARESPQAVELVAPSDAESLCGTRLDWIEAVKF
jgi:hypothetical protein